MKYIIFIFGETDNQDKFVNLLCDNIILNIKVEYIKFFSKTIALCDSLLTAHQGLCQNKSLNTQI